jgi:hypothetical protein
MNFDAGWRADGTPARDAGGLVAASVAGGTSTVRLRYRPAGLAGGLVVLGVTLLGAGGVLLAGRRRRAAGEAKVKA